MVPNKRNPIKKPTRKVKKLVPIVHYNSLGTILAALMGNFFVMILKFIGYGITSSPSMLAESLHSFGDVMNQALLYAGVQRSKRKATIEHPHGLGPVQYLFNFMSAIGVFTLGCVVTIWHAVSDYANPGPVNSWWLVSVIILTISFLVEGYTCYVAFKEVYKQKGNQRLLKYLRHSDDSALIAVLLEDSAAVLGIVLALSGIILTRITGNHVFDVLSAVTIGVMMGFIAWFLGTSNAKLLIGKAIPEDKEKEYKNFIQSLNSVDKVSELRTEVLGPRRVYLSFKADLHPMYFMNLDHLSDSAEEIKNGESPIKVLMEVSDRAVRSTAREIVQIEKLIKERFPEVAIIDLELD
jgi:zinc transporter 9